MGSANNNMIGKKSVIFTLISVVIVVLLFVVVVVYKDAIFSEKQQQIVEKTATSSETSKKSNNVEEQPTQQTPEKSTPPSEKVDTSAQNQSIVDENGYIEGQKLPSEPTYIKGILVANKKYPLPANYAPGVDQKAELALNTMFTAAKVNGYELTAFSSFRSFDYQKQLYTKYVKKDGQKAADRYSARPGYSEHQSGLAFDIGEIGQEDLWLTEAFGNTEAGQWLHAHAHEYGFILRYPKGKEATTGYMYESWHFRYVGIKLAKEIYEQNVTLEEYLNIQ